MTDVRLTLSNGDVVEGTKVSQDGKQSITVETSDGEVTIPFDDVVGVVETH